MYVIIYFLLSHPTRGEWIEIADVGIVLPPLWSHPTRDGWIEIQVNSISLSWPHVPSHTGWVD